MKDQDTTEEINVASEYVKMCLPWLAREVQIKT